MGISRKGRVILVIFRNISINVNEPAGLRTSTYRVTTKNYITMKIDFYKVTQDVGHHLLIIFSLTYTESRKYFD